MYGALPAVGRLSRMPCAHRVAHIFSSERQHGSEIETCPRCGARWVIWKSGVRERIRWGH